MKEKQDMVIEESKREEEQKEEEKEIFQEEESEEVREEDMLKQAGYPLAIIGAAFLIYGLIRKPEVRWE